MEVRQTSAELSHVHQWVMGGQTLRVKAKRRDESRRGRHECLRHIRHPACCGFEAMALSVASIDSGAARGKVEALVGA
jgi:hypothetical protein